MSKPRASWLNEGCVWPEVAFQVVPSEATHRTRVAFEPRESPGSSTSTRWHSWSKNTRLVGDRLMGELPAAMVTRTGSWCESRGPLVIEGAPPAPAASSSIRSGCGDSRTMRRPLAKPGKLAGWPFEATVHSIGALSRTSSTSSGNRWDQAPVANMRSPQPPHSLAGSPEESRWRARRM